MQRVLISSRFTARASFVDLLNKRAPNARQERMRARAGVRRRSCVRLARPSARGGLALFVLLAPLLDELAQRDREVSRGALQAVGAGLKLVDAARRLPRGDRGQRGLGLRIQTLGRRLHLLLGARQWFRGGR